MLILHTCMWNKLPAYWLNILCQLHHKEYVSKSVVAVIGFCHSQQAFTEKYHQMLEHEKLSRKMLAQDVSCQTTKCLWVEEIYQGQWQHGSVDQRLGRGRLQTDNIDKVQDVTSICLLVIFTTLELEYSQLHCLTFSIKQAGFSENNERKLNIFFQTV